MSVVDDAMLLYANIRGQLGLARIARGTPCLLPVGGGETESRGEGLAMQFHIHSHNMSTY